MSWGSCHDAAQGGDGQSEQVRDKRATYVIKRREVTLSSTPSYSKGNRTFFMQIGREAGFCLTSVAYVRIDVVAHLLNLFVSLAWKTAACP